MNRPSRGLLAGALLTGLSLGLAVVLIPSPRAGARDKAPDPAKAGDKPAAAADKPDAPPMPALPLDRAFARHVNFNRLGSAVRHMDSAALTDAALNMADCERVLHRPYAALPADRLMGMAAQLAAEKRDKASLERLAAAAEKAGNTALVGQIHTAQKLADAPRAVEPDKMIVVTDVNPARFALTREYQHYMGVAKLTGDAGLLDRMDQFLTSDNRLNPNEKSKLQKDLASAKSALPEKPDSVRLALGELAFASRDDGDDNGGDAGDGGDNGGGDATDGGDNGGGDNGDNGGGDATDGGDNGDACPPYCDQSACVTDPNANGFCNNGGQQNVVAPRRRHTAPVVRTRPAVIYRHPAVVRQPNRFRFRTRDLEGQKAEDPAFAKYVRLEDLSNAWAASDPASLTDAGLEMAEGERVLGRTHKSGIKAESVLRKAVALAADKRDKATLDRLAAVAEAGDDAGLKGQVQSARKLSGGERAVDLALQLDVEQTSSSDLARYQELVSAVRSAELLGDADALKAIDKQLDAPPALSASQKDEIRKLIVRARQGLPDKLSPDEDALCKLVCPSREYVPTKVQGTWNSSVGPTVVLAGADSEEDGWLSGKATDSSGQTTRYRWKPAGEDAGVLYVGGEGVSLIGPMQVTLSGGGKVMRWQTKGAPAMTFSRGE